MATDMRNMRLVAGGIGAAVLSALLTAGCSAQDGGQRAIFPTSAGYTTTMRTQTDEITDIGFEPFYNQTGKRIRLRSVTFASPPRELPVLNVRAYNYKQTKETVLGLSGDLAKECPQYFKPKPITSSVTPPRRVVLVVRRDRLHHLQTRPLLSPAGKNRLHRSRPPRLAVHSHQHDHGHQKPAQTGPNAPTLIGGLRIASAALSSPRLNGGRACPCAGELLTVR